MLGVILLLVVAVFGFRYVQGTLQDYRRLEQETFSGVFVANYATDYYDEEILTVYRGVPTVKAMQQMRKTKDFAHYFNRVWSSGNQITHVYLGVDPYLIWQEAGGKQDQWEKILYDYFQIYVEAHPDVTFEVLLPYDSMRAWCSYEEAEISQRLDSFRAFVDVLGTYENVLLYYVGSQEWLVGNPANYIEGQANEEIAKKLTLLCFCDHEYVITPVNADVMLQELGQLLKQEKEDPAEYMDLSDYTIVFMGDSVFGNFEGSHSIPGVVEGLTNAACYNLAIGGIPASVDPGAAYSLPYMVETLINGGDPALEVSDAYAVRLQNYLDAQKRSKLAFVLNFGLNDYFGGHPVDREDKNDTATFAGALRAGITMLQEAYPDALIIVQTPSYVNYFAEGTEVRCEDGTNRVLIDYIAAAAAVAEETGVYCFDNYHGFMDGSNYEQYLADGCHPNDYGRLVFGTRLIRFMEDILFNE